MAYKATLKHLGDAVEIVIDQEDPKAALQEAKNEAARVFGYKSGDAGGAPTISLKWMVAE